MQITIISSDSAEVFGSLKELEQELYASASAEYTQSVLRHIRDGETDFTMINGEDREHYTIEK
jgi:hypothetical protein